MTSLVFAYGAGLLSTVNPCGFALLPAFLGFYLGDRDGDVGGGSTGRLLQGFAVGLAVSAGFAGVFVVAGLLLTAGLRPIITALPWAAVIVGVVLAAVGTAMIAGRHVGVTVPTRFSRDGGRSYRRVVLFGGAYALASLSCTVAVLLAIVGQALAAGSVPRLLGVFLAYSAGAATVLTGLSVSASMARGLMARSMRRMLPIVRRLGGLTLVASGVYVVAYWLPRVLDPGSLGAQSVTGISERASAELTSLLAGHEGVLAIVGALLLLGGLLAADNHRRARRASNVDEEFVADPVPAAGDAVRP